MKIAILVSMFLPKWIGGVEIATQNIARHLALLGHDVCIITSFDRGLQKESQENTFFMHRIFYPKIKFLGVAFFWIKCILLLKKINPEVAHAQSIHMGIPCFLAKKLFNIPYIVYCHGSDVYLPWKFKKIISKLVLENAGAVVVLTSHMKKELAPFHIKNILVIPNGIELKKFQNLSRINVQKELKINETENIILFVGNLKAVKGLQYLIEAMHMVKEKKLNTRLLLVGDGQQKKELETLVEKINLKENVNFIGRVDNKEIPKYMVVSDMLVLPSISEGLPVVVLEAMALGLIIVATNVGGVSEIIEDKENGFLVEPKNSAQLAEKILYVLSNNDVRKSISMHNIKKAQNYSWDLMVNKLIAAYFLCQNKK